MLLLDAVAVSADDAGVLATDRIAAIEALSALPEQQREALLLVAWDGLTPDQAATVLGIRSGAFRVRAYRARQALDGNTTELFVAATPAALNEGGIR